MREMTLDQRAEALVLAATTLKLQRPDKRTPQERFDELMKMARTPVGLLKNG
jgi:hypothetical protein